MTAIARTDRRPSGRAVLGAALLAIGALLLAGTVFPGIDSYTLLLVSGVALIAFVASRDYAFAVTAGITGGLGTMVAIVSSFTLDATAAGGVFFLALAGGFTAIWLLGLAAVPRERHPWPLVPAAILGILGAAVATQTAATFAWLQVAIAAAIVVTGVVLIVRRERPES